MVTVAETVAAEDKPHQLRVVHALIRQLGEATDPDGKGRKGRVLELVFKHCPGGHWPTIGSENNVLLRGAPDWTRQSDAAEVANWGGGAVSMMYYCAANDSEGCLRRTQRILTVTSWRDGRRGDSLQRKVVRARARRSSARVGGGKLHGVQ